MSKKPSDIKHSKDRLHDVIRDGSVKRYCTRVIVTSSIPGSDSEIHIYWFTSEKEETVSEGWNKTRLN